jgi:hypothetical protein
MKLNFSINLILKDEKNKILKKVKLAKLINRPMNLLKYNNIVFLETIFYNYMIKIKKKDDNIIKFN